MRFLEPDVKHVQAYVEPEIALFHLLGGQAPLSQVDSQAEAVVPAEHRQRHAQGNAHRIHVRAAHGIIGLVEVGAGPVGAAFEEIADVVAVGRDFHTHADRLSDGRGESHIAHVGETGHQVHTGTAPVGAGIVGLYHENVRLAVADSYAQLISHGSAGGDEGGGDGGVTVDSLYLVAVVLYFSNLR